jgi:hypothetical protein
MTTDRNLIYQTSAIPNVYTKRKHHRVFIVCGASDFENVKPRLFCHKSQSLMLSDNELNEDCCNIFILNQTPRQMKQHIILHWRLDSFN